MDIHLARLNARHQLTAEEEEAVRGLIRETRQLSSGTVAIREGQALNSSTLLLEGLMGRYKDLANGQRQITEIHVPGDFADLHSFTLKRLDHNILALTDCTVGLVPHERLRAVTEQHPHLTRIYWFGTNLDASIHREWELSLGRRTAEQRLAAFFCELDARLNLVGLADAGGYALPLTQAELSECLGLTPIHVNRMLRQLREKGLVTFTGGRVSFGDRAALRRVAEFDPAYLYLDPEPI